MLNRQRNLCIIKLVIHTQPVKNPASSYTQITLRIHVPFYFDGTNHVQLLPYFSVYLHIKILSHIFLPCGRLNYWA